MDILQVDEDIHSGIFLVCFESCTVLFVSVKVSDSRPKPNNNEQSKFSSSASGSASTQDARKKTSELKTDHLQCDATFL